MKEFIIIWIGQLISSIGSWIAGILMFVFVFIFGSKKSIYEIEGGIR